MKKFLLILFTAFLLITFPLIVSAAAEVFVSPDGSDYNPGSIDAPFATTSKAVEVSRGLNSPIIYLRGGIYKAAGTVNLNKDNSGLTISAYNNENVCISGSGIISGSDLAPVTDEAVLKRIPESGNKNKVRRVYLPDIGITDFGQIKVQGFLSTAASGYAPTLTYNDKLMTYARYPNSGYLKIASVLSTSTTSDIDNLASADFTISDTRWKNWSQADDVWAFGYYKYEWADTTAPVIINQTAGSMKTYTGKSYLMAAGKRIYFFNLLEELDMPGEWYLDRKSGYLYVIPPEGFSESDFFRFSSSNKDFINVTDASDVTIRGIRFEGTTARAVYAKNCTRLLIDKCEVTAVGDTSIFINNCTYSGVANSHLHDLGSWGVYLSNCGNRKTLTNAYCFVENSHIHTYSQYRKTYCPAVHVSGCGNIISHNKIHDAPHFGIRYDANETLIEYNEFYDLTKDTADTGMVYTGRDWTMRGNVIRYNYFHDVTQADSNAIYLDDMHAATKAYCNVFYRVSRPALYGGGRYCTFENNLMIDCTGYFRFDNRGMSWSLDSLYANLNAMPYNTGVWAEKYPELSGILNDNPGYPKHNTIRNNILYKTPAMSIDSNVSKYGTVENNITITDPSVFTDYSGGIFSLKSNEFPNLMRIPFEDMGLYKSGEAKPLARPEYSSLRLKREGKRLVAYREYNGSYFLTNESFIWYVSNNGETYAPIDGETGDSLNLDWKLANKYVKYSVTAVNNRGISGSETFSEPIFISSLDFSQALTVSTPVLLQNGETDKPALKGPAQVCFNVTSNDINPVYATIIVAQYTDKNCTNLSGTKIIRETISDHNEYKVDMDILVDGAGIKVFILSPFLEPAVINNREINK